MKKEVVPYDFFKFAREDLKTAELCYNNQIYNNAIFHLQQACEKTAKGILLGISLDEKHKEALLGMKLNEENKIDFKSYSNNKLFEKLIKSIEKTNLDFKKGYGHKWYKKVIKIIKLFCNALKNSEQNVALLGFSEKEKDDLINEFNDFNVFTKQKRSIEDAIAKVKELSLKEEQYSTVNIYFGNFLDLFKLAYISRVLNYYEDLSRYPSIEYKLEDFNSEMDILKNFDSIKEIIYKLV